MKTATQHSNWKAEILESYKTSVEMTKSDLTVKSYVSDVSRFLEVLTIKNIGTLKDSHIQSYLNAQKQAGKLASTVCRAYNSLKSFCDYLRKIKGIYVDFDNIDVPRVVQSAPKIPTVQEIQQLLSMPDLETATGVRDAAILELLYSSGLRVSEVINLQLSDYLKTAVVIRNSKRNKTRTVPITMRAQEAIDRYLDVYRSDQEGELFVNLWGNKLVASTIWRAVKLYAGMAGITDITTHTLRHACATHLLDCGADLRLIQEILGHDNINTTQRYTHLTSVTMNDMFKKFHPLEQRN